MSAFVFACELWDPSGAALLVLSLLCELMCASILFSWCPPFTLALTLSPLLRGSLSRGVLMEPSFRADCSKVSGSLHMSDCGGGVSEFVVIFSRRKACVVEDAQDTEL